MLPKRKLGQSDIEVSAIGLGTWAIGGVMANEDGSGHSWGSIDDDEAVLSMQWAIDAGVNFFDTSNNYGCGHAERLVGRAIAGRRDQVVIATKFGYVCKPGTRIILGPDASRVAIEHMLETSLHNLGTDYIDLYHLHIYDLDVDEALRVRDLLETFVEQGKIRSYGWSTNNPERVQAFVGGEHCVAIQHHFNIMVRTQAVFDICRTAGVTTIARGPLGMGLLTGKYTHSTIMPDDDFRNDWNCQDGQEGRQLQLLDKIRALLTQRGHTLPQAALAWLLTLDSAVVPIPGFKTLAQVQENVGVLEKGLLSAEQMTEIDDILTPEHILFR